MCLWSQHFTCWPLFIELSHQHCPVTLVSHSPLAHHILLTPRNAGQLPGTMPGAISNSQITTQRCAVDRPGKGPCLQCELEPGLGHGQLLPFTAVSMFADSHENTAHVGFGVGNKVQPVCESTNTGSSQNEDMFLGLAFLLASVHPPQLSVITFRQCLHHALSSNCL